MTVESYLAGTRETMGSRMVHLRIDILRDDEFLYKAFRDYIDKHEFINLCDMAPDYTELRIWSVDVQRPEAPPGLEIELYPVVDKRSLRNLDLIQWHVEVNYYNQSPDGLERTGLLFNPVDGFWFNVDISSGHIFDRELSKSL